MGGAGRLQIFPSKVSIVNIAHLLKTYKYLLHDQNRLFERLAAELVPALGYNAYCSFLPDDICLHTEVPNRVP